MKDEELERLAFLGHGDAINQLIAERDALRKTLGEAEAYCCAKDDPLCKHQRAKMVR